MNEGRDRVGVYRSTIFYADTGADGWSADSTLEWPGIQFGWQPADGSPSPDVPVVGDWNNDGYTDFGVYRLGQWIPDEGARGWQATHNEIHGFWFGSATDVAVPGDFNGDGYTDRAFWNGTTLVR